MGSRDLPLPRTRRADRRTPTPIGETAPDADRKLIIRITVGVEVDDVAASVDRVIALAEQHGGELSASSMDLSDPRFAGGDLVFRLPPAETEAFIAELDPGIGRRTSLQTSSEDVTLRSTDLDTRIETARASLDRVRALLVEAKNIGEVITLESELTQRQNTLEELLAEKTYLDGQVAMSTVTVHLAATGTVPDGRGPGRRRRVRPRLATTSWNSCAASSWWSGAPFRSWCSSPHWAASSGWSRAGRRDEIDQALHRTHQLRTKICKRPHLVPEPRPEPLEIGAERGAEARLPLHVSRHVGPFGESHHTRPHPGPHVDEGMTGDQHMGSGDLAGEPVLLRAGDEVIDEDAQSTVDAGLELVRPSTPRCRGRASVRRRCPTRADRRPTRVPPTRRRDGPRPRCGWPPPTAPAAERRDFTEPLAVRPGVDDDSNLGRASVTGFPSSRKPPSFHTNSRRFPCGRGA